MAQEEFGKCSQICFFMSHFIQVEHLIIPIPTAISFLDRASVGSGCLLSWSARLYVKSYSLHAQIEPDGGDILIAQYVWRNKKPFIHHAIGWATFLFIISLLSNALPINDAVIYAKTQFGIFTNLGQTLSSRILIPKMMLSEVEKLFRYLKVSKRL